MESRLVSIIIPAFNMAPTIQETVESILNQTYSNFELLIIDDGSTDDTKHIIDKYLLYGKKYDSRISYFFQINNGRVAAINTGIKNSRGSYITYVDADDTLPSDSIYCRVCVLNKFPEVMTVYADSNCIDENSQVFKIRKSKQVFSQEQLINFNRNPIVSSSVMFRKEVMEKIVEFDSSFKRLTDVCMNVELFRAGKMYYFSGIVYNFRTYKRKGIYKLRLKTLYYFIKVIDKYYTGSRKYYYMFIQTIIQTIKLIFELFSVHK